MQSVQLKYGTGMTVAACLWAGLFPQLHMGTYAFITKNKWTFMVILCGITLACFLLDLFLGMRVDQDRESPTFQAFRGTSSLLPLILAGGLLLCAMLSCLLGPYSSKEWWIGASDRREGLAAQLCYLGLFFCFALSRVRLKPVLLSAAAGVFLFAVPVFLQRGGGNPFGLYPAGRSYALNPEFQGSIGNVDMDTGYLCTVAGFLLYGGIESVRSLRCGRSRADRVLSAACLAGLLLSVYLIVTMGVQFGVISLAAIVLVVVLRIVPKKYRLPLLLVLLALVFLVVWFWPGTGGGIWELHETLHGRARLSFGSNRVAVWYYTLRLAGTRLLLGSGSDTFKLSFNRFIAENDLVIPKEQDGVPLPHYFDNPHNEYLAQLINHGLPAMLLLIALVLCAVWRRRDRLLPVPDPYSAAVLCYAVQAFFSFSVCMVAPLFWMFLGLSLNVREPAENLSA